MFGLGVNRLGRLNSSIQTFTPASLFNNGEAGVWYDPSAASGSLDWRKNLLEYTESFDNSYWSKENTSIGSNQTAAPDGTNTADKIKEVNTTDTFHFVTRALVSSAGVKTFSAYFKADERSFAGLTLRVNSGSDRLAVLFNLTNGTVSDTITLGSPTQTSSSIQDVGNGWYRCSVSAYHSTGSVLSLISPHNDGTSGNINMTYAGTVGYGVYIWGSQLEEASTASSYQPILSTFANSFKAAFPSHTLYQDYQGETPVTAVGEPVGLMLDKSKGLAQGPELVTNGDFSNGTTEWSAGNGTMSVVSGELKFTATAAGHYLRQVIIVEPNHTYKLFWTARLGTAQSAKFSVYDATASSDIISPTIYSASSTSQVFSATFTTPANCVSVGIYPLRDSGVTGTYYIDNVSVTEIQGSHATQPTSTKRPIYARHPEGGIRNLLNYTEQFENWSISSATLTPNQIAAPDGTLTADKLTTLTTSFYRYTSQAATLTQGSTYSVSCYVKNHSSANSWLRVRGSISSGSVVINWSGASITSLTTYEPLVSSSFESVGNDWYRVTLTVNADEVASIIRIYPSDTGDSPSTGSIYIWGAQVEEATEASNYQKVVTDIDVTESGVGEVYYLKFDGTDDGMFINNLTSGNTPVTTLFGYSATNAESTISKYLLDIQFGRTIFAASTYVTGQVGYYDGQWSEFAADLDAIKVLTYDLVENDAKIRIDGTQEYSDTTYDQQAIGGEIRLFTSYGTDLRCLGGNMYQTILRAAESTDEEIAKAETYVANKTGLKAQVDGIATLDLNFGANLYTAKNSNGGVI